MDLRLTAENEMVQGTARDFAQREVTPNLKDRDRIKSMAHTMMSRAADLGFLGCLPVSFGEKG